MTDGNNQHLTALVTGGAGFVGSHMCDRLISEGFQVILVDTLLTGMLDNIRHLMEHPRFAFVQADVTKPLEIPESVDYVLHLASPASPKDYALHPIHTLKVGALGTYHVLGLAKAKGAVFLLASSSEVYGDPEVNPQPEAYWGRVNPVGPRSVYDEAKRFAEAITVAYHETHGLDIRIARIFNTYGPRMRMDDGRVLPTFMTQALQGEPLTVYGNGSQTRSLCYVDDLIEGLYRLLNFKSRPAASSSDLIFNLGNPEELTMLELAQEVIQVTGSRSEIVFRPLPTDDPKIRCPEITRAITFLGWKPKIPRGEGLRRVVPYFRESLAARG